jgi:hypothetical protein
MILKADDREWLARAFPGLNPTSTGLVGVIEFRAAFDSDSGLFQILGEDSPAEGGGLLLAGRFTVRIEARTAKYSSALPALNVEEIEPSPDRHFGPDKSACLCSALEEDEFLTPDFQLQSFLERLVIPFLYGQVFYSLKQCWPWPEYAHGATGLLESYGRFPVPAKLDSFLQTLTECRESWPAIRAVLLQRDYIKGHTACFCEKKDQIRRCHPGALQGIRQLRDDVRDAKKVIP